jgi:DDE domain
MDETYIKVKGQWYYLYRAVDKTGQTIDFLLTEQRDERAQGVNECLSPRSSSTLKVGESSGRCLRRSCEGLARTLQFLGGRLLQFPGADVVSHS